VEAARVAAALIPDRAGQVADPERWAREQTQVEDAAASLEVAGSKAPSAEGAAAAREAAQAMRSAAFAVESDRLLREHAPTPTELTEADAAIRQLIAEMHGTLEGIDALVNPNRQHEGG
jgi:hypothetical protein